MIEFNKIVKEAGYEFCGSEDIRGTARPEFWTNEEGEKFWSEEEVLISIIKEHRSLKEKLNFLDLEGEL